MEKDNPTCYNKLMIDSKMESFYFCWLAILKEANKHGVFFAKKSKNAFGASPNFSLTINRLEYLYKRGTLIMNLVSEGILNSSKSSPEILKLYHDLISKQNCKICSLSNGPGVEVVGLFHGFEKHVNVFKSMSVCVATKSNEWKALSEILINGKQQSIVPSLYSAISCTPTNFQFLSSEMDALTPEVRQNVQYCDALLMFKSYEFCPDLTIFKKNLTEIFSLMKKDAIIFFFDSKARMKLFESLASCGKLLYGPLKVTVKDIGFDADFTKLVGHDPIKEGEINFALWKKGVVHRTRNSESMQHVKVQGGKVSAQVDNIITKVSSSSSLSSYSDVNISNNILQDFNSCKSTSNEHIPQKKLNAKTIEEKKGPNFLSNEDSESNKSSTMSETSTSNKSSLSQTDSSTNPTMFDKIREDLQSDCQNSSKISSCIKNLIQQKENTDKSKLNVMVEHCEKMISSLEKSLETLSVKIKSAENMHVNCCSHNQKHFHNCCCRSHVPCHSLHSRCCHCFRNQRLMTCHNADNNCISSKYDKPYLLIPLQNNALLMDAVNILHNNN